MPMARGFRFTSDDGGTRYEEVEYTDAEIAALEAKEIRLRLNLVEADEVLHQIPSTAIEFARWYLKGKE